MVKPWTAETNIANDSIRLVKFYFETSEGPGECSAIVNKGVTIEQAKQQMLDAFELAYKSMNPEMELKIVKHEIIRFIDDLDDLDK